MQKSVPQLSSENIRSLPDISELREFNGHPAAFWPLFLKFAAIQCEAAKTILVKQQSSTCDWKSLLIWPESIEQNCDTDPLTSLIEQHATQLIANSNSLSFFTFPLENHSYKNFLVLKLHVNHSEDYSCVLLYKNITPQKEEELLKRIPLISDLPAAYFQSRKLNRTNNESFYFAETLDLMTLLNSETSFMSAVMTFCNEVAARFENIRVSLGWIEQGYIRIQSISHMDKIEKKMAVIQSLEAAMEEAFDQDEEIVSPSIFENSAITLDHESYAKEQAIPYILSLPVRIAGEPVAVVTCERSEKKYTEKEILGIRLLCDQAARRLADLKIKDRWIGARIVSTLKESTTNFFRVKHTFAKGVGLLGFIIIAFLLLGSLPYRIESPFILKSDDVQYLPAPFEGYIENVNVKVGDHVKQGDYLLLLDTEKLLLEESAAIAHQIRYARETEKARAENNLAEMKIALSLTEQASAQLDLVRYHLHLAEIKAPFDGVIIEGDLKELLGAPVKKGDILFKISKIKKMHAELLVNEKDIHELSINNQVEMAFVSQPELKYYAKIYRIDPVAQTSEKGNIFLVHCTLPANYADWWRPGMSGIAKVILGSRNAFWVLTHRTTDYLRIALWW